MNVLILGSGAREHALAWKLKHQGECHHIWLFPGNAGTRLEGFSHFPEHLSREELVIQAHRDSIGLVVIGPESFLELGYADCFRKAGIAVVGPNREAAQLETSKIFAKHFLVEAGIPTAPFQIFESEAALLKSPHPDHTPWVLKLDGLASGKGVVITHSKKEVEAFARAVWKDHLFGTSNQRVLAEDFLPGREISYIGFCDGRSFIPLATATDHKRVFDADQGPNTGGMGAISPSPYVHAELEKTIHQRIVDPLLQNIQKRQLDFRGVLFLGLMIDEHHQPRVLEINTRMGDPETQAVLPRLTSSLLQLLQATATGDLQRIPLPEWDARHSVYVVACAQGYPQAPQLGQRITGTGQLSKEAFLFFGGVGQEQNELVTRGGRVLGVGAMAETLAAARDKAYQYLKPIHWPGIHYRFDIGNQLKPAQLPRSSA